MDRVSDEWLGTKIDDLKNDERIIGRMWPGSTESMILQALCELKERREWTAECQDCRHGSNFDPAIHPSI